MLNVLSFAEAIADSEECAKRHLILGNGFSIACCPDIFHYGSLFDAADFSKMPEVKTVFDALGTQDFEVAIHALENSAKLFPIYCPESPFSVKKALHQAAAIKEVLVSTIAGNHPENPHAVQDAKFWACRKFLSHFLTSPKGGHVFTLNYDLLLYWTIMHGDNPFGSQKIDLKKNDSFGNDENDPTADYVVWQGETKAHISNIYFLHGALHLFDAGSELQKYTWIRNGTPLVEQVRSAIAADKFPLFVAEGTSLQKKNKIRHNAYLYQSLKMLTTNSNIGTHCFFIFGHSLAENDNHVLDELGGGKFKKLYVSLHGKPDSPENQKIISRANGISLLRDQQPKLEVVFFDSASANVWGAQS